MSPIEVGVVRKDAADLDGLKQNSPAAAERQPMAKYRHRVVARNTSVGFVVDA